jgi:hypothetical protein
MLKHFSYRLLVFVWKSIYKGVLLLLFIGLRQLEYAMTYHPLPYIPGPDWTPPANGEDVWFKVTNDERAHGWLVMRSISAGDSNGSLLPWQ